MIEFHAIAAALRAVGSHECRATPGEDVEHDLAAARDVEYRVLDHLRIFRRDVFALFAVAGACSDIPAGIRPDI